VGRLDALLESATASLRPGEKELFQFARDETFRRASPTFARPAIGPSISTRWHKVESVYSALVAAPMILSLGCGGAEPARVRDLGVECRDIMSARLSCYNGCLAHLIVVVGHPEPRLPPPPSAAPLTPPTPTSATPAIIILHTQATHCRCCARPRDLTLQAGFIPPCLPMTAPASTVGMARRKPDFAPQRRPTFEITPR
jgi:hypothetical protein